MTGFLISMGWEAPLLMIIVTVQDGKVCDEANSNVRLSETSSTGPGQCPLSVLFLRKTHYSIGALSLSSSSMYFTLGGWLLAQPSLDNTNNTNSTYRRDSLTGRASTLLSTSGKKVSCFWSRFVF